ncbi:Sialic acid TRAP transporter permease protein SiaT [Roseivivax jejudonensis]|uniref:TRAP transporter large permease protein n=1 Tax=Roseivivax jejudonensis TaxID=1529041 RepID=A0A1X6ZX84_9RHOB|nr:TRAP transporter large permease [Roseivivax jejudonensis]SLN63747.1 Sialic acid TRAP transporter permease protein SiaT [Roseivivax jejudonensis]
MTAALLGFGILLILLLAGFPVGFSMMAVGVAGTSALIGLEPALSIAAQTLVATVQQYELTVIPLFVLMGNLIASARLADDLFGAANAYIGHRRGGLAAATIVACTGFSAVSGSSLATAATMTRVALPAMRKFRYDPGFAAGSIAAGGTLGILIPPSAALILYGIITSQSIEQLFLAGVLPGLLGMLCYLGAVWLVTRRNPGHGPSGDVVDRAEKRRRLVKVWPTIALFTFVLGGLYVGAFAATEAAGIGAAGAFVIALARRTLTVSGFVTVLIDSARTTGVLFGVLIGALIFANLINLGRLPDLLSDWILSLDLQVMTVVCLIMLIYLLLGCLLESISMMLLTVPVFFPVVSALGVDPIWFGIVVVVAIEISLITPPVGMNLFVLRAVAPDVALSQVYRGVGPFVIADLVRLILLLAFPAIALMLPATMM